MGYTFSANILDASIWHKDEPCLCAQNAECFSEALHEMQLNHRTELATVAWSKCPSCNGSGVETVSVSDAPCLNLANDNAGRLLSVLGLPAVYMGEVSIPGARRALMRARARTSLLAFTRSSEVICGEPRNNEDGTVELHPVRSYIFGLTEEKLEDYISRFANFVEESARRGATTLYWA